MEAHCSGGAGSSAVATSETNGIGLSIPRVVKFAYRDFRAADDKWSAVCTKCHKTLSDKSGVTTSFTKHLRRMHGDLYKEYQDSVDRASSIRGQSTLNSFVINDSGTTYGHGSLRQKAITSSLVTNLIVSCGLPVSIVDHPAFCKFLTELDPKYKPPVRQTVTQSILPQLLQAQKTKLMSLLELCTDVSLTADIWTDRRMHSFLGVSVHTFVNGIAESYLLAFQSFTGSHTGQRIAHSLESIITESGLQHKIRCIVTDNASNMKKALSLVFEVDDTAVTTDGETDDPTIWEDDTITDLTLEPDIERIPCFAHSLQLVVRDGLSSLSVVRPLLAKCCKLSNLIHQSALFRSIYEEVIGKIIPSTNETRWNSTYQQLKTTSELDQAKLNDLLRENGHGNLVMTSKELANLRDIVHILEPFSEATDIVQSDKTVTISCVAPILLSLNRHTESCLTATSSMNAFVRSLQNSLRDRFATLFAQLGINFHLHCANSLSFGSDLYLMAPALDPAYAFNWLEDHPGSAEDKEAQRFKITGLLYTELGKLANHQSLRPATHLPALKKDHTCVENASPPAKRRCSLFGHYRNTSTPAAEMVEVTPQRQMAEYLQDINSPGSQMTIERAACSPKFGHLQPLFQRILCTPATSAPVERIFSQSGIIMRPHRARMSDTLLETLVFLKCNSKLNG